MVIVLEGRLDRADRRRSAYRLVPFDVEGPATALRIRLAVDRPGADSVVDLGLFGPGPTGFGSDAFRGWSGSERSEVIVAVDRATPGYRPGPIVPGRWHVLLGLCRLPPEGCAYRIAVEVGDGSPAWLAGLAAVPLPGDDRPAALAAPEPDSRLRWYRGDLHAHTIHSDGADDPATVVATARRIGLDFLAVTDHNTDSHLAWLAGLGGGGFLVLGGEEITTYDGHANAWGIDRWVDFRPDVGPGIAGTIEAVHAQGGLVSINHPKPDDPWRHDPDLPVDAVEVWNGPWAGIDPDHANDVSLAWWTALLGRGRRPTAVGGSDMHSPRPADHPLGTPVTWVHATGLDRTAILDGIRAGRVVISRDPIGPRPDLVVGAPDGLRRSIGEELAVGPDTALEVEWRVRGGRGMRLRLVSARGVEADREIDSGDARGTIRLAAPAGGRPTRDHVRVEVRAPGGAMAALTNPVHVVTGQPADWRTA